MIFKRVARSRGRRSQQEEEKHRRWARRVVGPPQYFDLITAMSFGLLTTLGLREHHRLLDVGCGSLRVGRLLIPYLEAGNYVGIDPNEEAIEAGRRLHVGEDLIRIKRPTLIASADPADVPSSPPFDFAFAQSVFSHTGEDLLRGWLEGISSRLAETGVLVASYVPGEDNAPPGWEEAFVTYSPAGLERHAEAAGLTMAPIDWRHPGQAWALFCKPGFDTSWFAERPLTWSTYLDHLLGPPWFRDDGAGSSSLSTPSTHAEEQH